MIQLHNLKVFVFLLCALLSFNGFSQEEGEEDSGKLPVRSPFEAGTLIDNPTIVNPLKGALEFNILHRFGLIDENGISDVFGIYATSNIKMGLNYGITDRIMAGIGYSKDYKLLDLNWKVALLQQSRNGKVPVSVSYYGNFVTSLLEKEAFGPVDRFKDIHRFSYFTELMVARKLNEVFSLQVAPNFIYFNSLERGRNHVSAGVSVGGRAKIFSSSAIIFEYDQKITKADSLESKPNLAFGYEIGTATHCFQIFVANYSQIVPQYNYVFNTNDFTKGKYLFGFNITVRL
jgi:hypothetical protein